MIFEPVVYPYLLQDFFCSAGAGFAVGFANQLLASVLPGGKLARFAKDIIVSFIFAVAVFSYVISFTNYPVIRIYHILGALCGFCAFPVHFSTFFHKVFQKIFIFLKYKMLCLCGKIKSTICAKRQKTKQKKQPPQNAAQNDHLKNEDSLIYNL